MGDFWGLDEKTGCSGALAFVTVCSLFHVWAFDCGHQSANLLKEGSRRNSNGVTP